MSEAPDSVELMHGSCMCGEVTYTITNFTIKGSGLCHCNECQKVTGSTYSWNTLVPLSCMKVEGPVKMWPEPDPSSTSTKPKGVAFCAKCSSHFASYPDDQPDHCVLKVGTLDTKYKEAVGPPKMEMFTLRKSSWVSEVSGARQSPLAPY